MIKQIVKSSIVKVLEWMMSSGITLPLMNFLFENCGAKFRSFIIRNVKVQPLNYVWKTKLLNNKTFNVFIDNTWRSWQFAFNYRWHNMGESKVLQLLNDHYPMDNAFIDVGANLGLMTIYAVAIKRRGILFEPNKKLNEFTRTQYLYNNYTDYVIENYCLSDKPGKATFYISGSSFQSSLNKDLAAQDVYGGTTEELNVELISLDQYLSTRPDVKPCIIKVDAEGHDLEVLKGAVNTIKKFQPSMLVEVNSEQRPDIISFVQSLGYKCFGVNTDEKDFLIRQEREKEFAACLDVIFVSDESLLGKIAGIAK